MSAYEMRIYQVAPGSMSAIQQAFRELVVPLMREYSMEGIGYWVASDNQIYWVVRHESIDAIQPDWDRFHADPRWKEGLAARNGGAAMVVSQQSFPLMGIPGLPPESEAANRGVVATYATELFGKKDLSAIDRFVAPGFRQHNPHAEDGPEGIRRFAEYFFQANPQVSAEPKRMAASGDLVFIHSILKTSPEQRGSALVDVYRVEDGKIAEHWDVMQEIPEQTASGNPVV